MPLHRQIIALFVALREFFVPSYRPEQHYMRGPGPACARRQTSTQNFA